MARGGGAIIRGRQLFLIFSSKRGDYSREAINQGTAIIQGNTVYDEQDICVFSVRLVLLNVFFWWFVTMENVYS